MAKAKENTLTKQEELSLGEKIQKMKQIKNKMESGYDLLTEDENKTLQEGEQALQLLISNYYNMARKIAHDHHKKTNTKYDLEDLLQDAISALIKAAYDYDPNKNCRLSTYAYYGITKKVSTAINYQRLVRMPENKMGEYVLISSAQKEYHKLSYEEQKEYQSELEYIYLNVPLDKKEIDIILSNMQAQVSLNASIFDGEGEFMDLLVDQKADKEVTKISNLDEGVIEVLKKLSPFEKDLIAFEYGAYPASMKYSEFLKKHNMTDKQVKSETRKTVRKMRKISEKGKK